MTKFTQKQLRELVNSGWAIDVTNGDRAAIEYYANRYEKFGIDLFN